MAYFITRRAMRDLADIHAYSVKSFGSRVADRYIADLYAVFDLLVQKPNLGKMRGKRAEPFRMYPAREHFIVYEQKEKDIYVITVLAQVRNIEGIVAEIVTELNKLQSKQ